MQIDSQALRRHYASLSDDELLALDRSELTEVARKCYDAEFARRQPTPPQENDEPTSDAEALATPIEPPGDWLGDAACACSFEIAPGSRNAEEADHALAVLQAAGISSQIEVEEVNQPSEEARTYQHYRVMVPGALNLQAASVLDQEIFNEQAESEWRAHFEALSDEELRALSPDVICAGLKDKIRRLTRAYNDEVERRGE